MSNRGAAGVISFWKEFNFEQKKESWDEQVNEVAQHQQRSVQSRKNLATLTREFKQLPADERANKVTVLIKAYQEEVDQLTRRSKFSESLFTSIYKDLYDAPDPVNVLQTYDEEHDRLLELENSNRKLQNEVSVWKKKAAAQEEVEAALKRAEARIQELESQSSATLEQELQTKQLELEQQYKKKEKALQSREQNLQFRLENTENNLLNTRLLYERAQAQIAQIQAQSRTSSEGARVELLTQELDAASARVTELEATNETLQAKVKQLSAQLVVAEAPVKLSSAPDHEQLLEAAEEYHAKQLQSIETEYHRKLSNQNDRITQLEAQLSASKKEAQSLSTQLENTPTPEQYDQLKRELKNLKAVQFNDYDEEEEEEDQKQRQQQQQDEQKQRGNTASAGSSESSLVSMLVGKNRRLEDELTRQKLQLAELRHEYDGLDHEHHLTLQRVNQLEELNSSLDKELKLRRSSISTPNTPYRNTTSGAEDEPWDTISKPSAATGSSEDTQQQQQQQPSLSSSTFSYDTDSNANLLNVLRSQRDRFKSLCAEQDQKLRELQKDHDAQMFQLSALKSDNVQLYEKIRYLESYQPQQLATATATTGSMSAGASHADLDDMVIDLTPEDRHVDERDNDLELRYRPMYEQRLDPFQRFNSQERDSRIHNLNVAERVALRGGSILLSNKFLRNFIFFYSLALHMLMFLVLYKLSHCGGN